MLQLVTFATSFVAGCAVTFFVLRSSISARLTRITFPFLNFDVSQFDQLSPVKMFAKLGRAVLVEDANLTSRVSTMIDATPEALIHVGWNVVCTSSMERLDVFPDEEQIKKAAPIIGSQNAEFVQIHSRINAAVGRHSGKLKREFAADHLVRAPSLAQRINPDSDHRDSEMTHDLLTTSMDLLKQDRRGHVSRVRAIEHRP